MKKNFWKRTANILDKGTERSGFTKVDFIGLI